MGDAPDAVPVAPPAPGSPARRPRRADAERNRGRLIDAARQLVDERGLAAVTMYELARTAGVGKGTVYRAFESRAGVAQALVDDAERELQGAILDGPPPLGPGAAPAERARAFAEAYLDLVDGHTELLVEIDHHAPGRRFTTGAHAFWRAHLAGLARAAGHAEPGLTAELVLGLLAADLYRHLRDDLGTSQAAVRSTTVAAASAVFAAGQPE
jgi:AcrR family transcriptional regulator